MAHDDEGRKHGERKALDDRPIGIGEGEELVGQRPEELQRSGRVGGGQERNAAIGTGVVLEDALGRLEDPRALMGVGIDDDQDERERREPIPEGTRFAAN